MRRTVRDVMTREVVAVETRVGWAPADTAAQNPPSEPAPPA